MALTTNFRFAAIALSAGLVATPAAFAETAPPTMQFAQAEQSTGQQAEAVQPDEQQLESFVVATVRIIDIQQQAQQQMAATEEPEQQEQVRDQALQQIVAAVEEEGLSVDEYNGIVQQVENDPELGQTVQQRIQERVSE
jgi:rubrerythrin